MAKLTKKPSGKRIAVPVNPYEVPDKKNKASITFQAFQEKYSHEEYLDKEGFEKLLLKFGYSTTWVYIAVRRIADAVGQIPLNLVEPGLPGDRAERVKGYDFGLQDLVKKPNPWQHWADFAQALIVSLELTGNAYIERVYPKGGDRPYELYVLNPSRMTIMPDKKKYVQAYIYSTNGVQITFEPRQIIHIKYHHPMNDFYGFAPLTAARVAVNVDGAANRWNENFLLRGAWPVGALETENDLDEDDKRRLHRQIKQVVGGGYNTSGGLLLLSGGMKYHALSINPKDSDWADARRMSRDEILAIFGVPFAIAGLFSTEQTTARSAGVEQQIKQFYRTTIFPKVELIVAALNRGLVPLFRNTAEFVPDYRSVPALQEEVDQEKTRAEALLTMVKAGLSLNKALVRLYPDIEPEPWGDVAWLPDNLMAVKTGAIPPEIIERNKPKPPPATKPQAPKPKPVTATRRQLLLEDRTKGAWFRVKARLEQRKDKKQDLANS